MGYGDSPRGSPIGGGRRTTKKKRAKRAKKAKKAKRPCKYGRGADGYCNKKPSGGSYYDDREPAAPRRRTTSSSTRARRDLEKAAEKAVSGALEGGLRLATDPVFRQQVGALGRTSVSDIAKAGGAGAAILGGTALAGIAAYALTSYLIHRKPKKREEQLAAAAEAAQAYRAARVMAAETQGKPLTAAQQKILAGEFKKKLAALGVTSFSQKG